VIQSKITLLLLAGLTAASSLQAESAVGTRVVEINPETVSAACGDADGTQWINPFSVWLNPAGNVRREAAFLHKTWIEGDKIYGVGYSTSLPLVDLTTLVYTASVIDIPLQTDSDPEAEGVFTAHDLVISLTASRPLTRQLRLGLTGKYVYEKIYDEYAQGLAADFGFQYGLPWLDLSGSIANLGSMTALENEASDLPLTIRLSAGSTFDLGTVSLRLASGLVKVKAADPTCSLGGELTLKRLISFRGGYIFGHDTRSFSLGAGFQLRRWGCDYSYIPLKQLGDTSQFTITYTFP